MPSKNSVFEAPKLVTTKTLLLKHYYRRQGLFCGIFSSAKCVSSKNCLGKNNKQLNAPLFCGIFSSEARFA